LFGEDYNIAFVKTLLKVQNNIVNMPNGSEHFDIYLAKTIYPTLVPGLESLAREIDRLTSAEGKRFFLLIISVSLEQIDASIRERFNPCIFLAEFLMRNNPKHGNKTEY
jgi:hypothetical protein